MTGADAGVGGSAGFSTWSSNRGGTRDGIKRGFEPFITAVAADVISAGREGIAGMIGSDCGKEGGSGGNAAASDCIIAGRIGSDGNAEASDCFIAGRIGSDGNAAASDCIVAGRIGSDCGKGGGSGGSAAASDSGGAVFFAAIRSLRDAIKLKASRIGDTNEIRMASVILCYYCVECRMIARCIVSASMLCTTNLHRAASITALPENPHKDG